VSAVGDARKRQTQPTPTAVDAFIRKAVAVAWSQGYIAAMKDVEAELHCEPQATPNPYADGA
jgi:hypothetical protein